MLIRFLFRLVLAMNRGLCPCVHCSSYRWRMAQDMIEYEQHRKEAGL